MDIKISQNTQANSEDNKSFSSKQAAKTTSKNIIVLLGGGTAGHVMPNIALIPKLIKEFDEVHYIGSKGIEKNLITQESGVIYHEIACGKLRRKFSLKNLLIPFLVLKGYFQSKKILKNLNPAVVFSKGGYVAVPPAIACRKLKIPLIGHESDLTLGLANKIIYKQSNKMFCSFNETIKYGNKCEFSGTAIRENIFNGNKDLAIKKYKLDKNKKTILVIGGSSGSLEINNVLRANLDALLVSYNVLHIVGKGNIDSNIKKNHYEQIEFEKDPSNIFACSDLVISRAGSNAIFEFLALNKPMLLMPLSKKESRGDQILNAKVFEDNGYSLTLLSENISNESFLQKISELELSAPKLVKKMQNTKTNNGTNIILKELLKYKRK